MAVWLKCGDAELAFDGDIVPREALQQIVALEDVCAQVLADTTARAQAAAAQAEQAAAAVREQAEDHARRMRAATEGATRLGYAQGRRDALLHWHAQAQAQRDEARSRHAVLREHLADMVARATAALVRGPAMEGYLTAALAALDDMAGQDVALSITVHPGDRAAAEAALAALRPHWQEHGAVRLADDAALAPGSCICETPQGWMDASLSLHLKTLRLAVLGTLDTLELPADLRAAIAAPPPAGAAEGAPAPAPDRAPEGADRPADRFDEDDDAFFDEDHDGDEDDDEYDEFDDDESAGGPGGHRTPWSPR